MSKKIAFLFFIFLQIFFLNAKDKKNTENLPLLQTKWLLKEISETVLPHSSDTAFIIFTEDFKFSGNLGCNLFFGDFSFGKRRIRIDYLGATKKYCVSMQLEDEFVKILRNDITHYNIERNDLYLLSRGKVICKFEGITVSP